ncbi:MAG: Nif3-like dinuclear metal center hexameric protein, partial [Firmicutes bacterium]|nr:Nif3-like dinuclear metal center hexameric protein [Bacillota bacterium]
MKVKDIVDIMDKLAPKELIEDWDNTGFQLGNPEREVEKILLALDITKQTIDYAINEDIDMIITHHSLFFIPVKSIYSNTPKGKIIYKLV